MFNFLHKEAPLIQLYGKLPLAKDYLRVGCSEGAGREVRDWLDRGFSSAVDAAALPVFPWPMRFIAGAQDSAPLVGCAWPSSDAGGLRKFPFFLFVERRRRALLDELEPGLERAEAWWRKLEGVASARHNYSDGQSFLTALRSVSIEAAKIEPAPVARIALETWLEALWPGRGAEGLSELLGELDGLARIRFSGPLRLPLVSDLPLSTQVHAWLRTLTELKLLLRIELPTLFFPLAEVEGDEPAYLLVLRSELQPRDVSWLTSCRGRPDSREGDLCDGVAKRAGSSSSAHDSLPALSDSLRGALASFRARSG